MKELLDDIRLNRLLKLIEKLEKCDLSNKIKIFNKIKKHKITKKIGIFLIQNSTRNFNLDDPLGGVNSSLIELCFKDYYDEYTDEIEKIFKDLNENAQNRILFLLTTTDKESSIKLYVELILKYYKKRNIPIGDLGKKTYLYPYLFPKLFNALKFNIENNNIILLINDYLNSSTILKDDLNKNKKIIIDYICKTFKEALNFKYKDTYSYLNDDDYKVLRYYLETCINVEGYVSNKRTREYLDKLLKKHDNQIKLFILDNYIRNNIDLKDFKFNEIAKDDASRYALFEILTIYNKSNKMPKKYLDQILLAKSDFYTNFVISTSYKSEPINLEFYKKYEIDGFDYYAFKFKYKYNYNINTNEYLTDYIINQLGIEKHNGEEIESSFIGISGGFDKDKKISTIIKSPNSLLIEKIDDNTNIDDIVNNLIVDKKENIISQDLNKENKTKKEKKKEQRTDKKQLKLERKKNKTSKKEIKDNNITNELLSNEYDNDEKQSKIFFYIILFLVAIFISLFVYCILYIYGIASINEKNNEVTVRTSKLNKEFTFEEISGKDIFSKDGEYYVLLYKKPNQEKYTYYYYLNEYLKRKYILYYVDLNKDENKFLYAQNELNFTLYTDRFLKVKDHEYEYYVDGQNNIMNEMEEQIDKIIQDENNKDNKKDSKKETKKENTKENTTKK